MFSITFRPEDTLRTSSFVFQTEERKLVALLGGTDLKVADYAATRHANACGELSELGRLDCL